MIRQDQFQGRIRTLEDDLATVLKVDSDTLPNDRLNLAQPPVGLELMADDRAHVEKYLYHCCYLADAARLSHEIRQHREGTKR